MEATETDLSFKVSGLIEYIFFQEGDWVNSGQKTAGLEAKDLKDEVDRARATMLSAKANLAKLETGYRPQEIPLGSYIYDSARGQDPVIRLGMLHYFETKNIGKKTKRAEAFASYDDKLSQHEKELVTAFITEEGVLRPPYGAALERFVAAADPERAHRAP